MVSAAVERLIKDRISEFHQLAKSKNTLVAALQPSRSFTSTLESAAAGTSKQVAGKLGFMREFFDTVSELQSTLNQGRANVKLMGGILDEALQATTQDTEKAVSDRLQHLVQETNDHITSVKFGLERLKVKSDEEAKRKPSSAEVKIRTNMQQAMARKHQQLLVDFQKAQVDFKQALERRQTREMEILMPDATDEERAQMIEDGETTSLIVAKKMAGTHALLLDEVQRIREKHHDILQLERSIEDLAQMFQDMAVLVEAQGEMLDAIEVHVSRTKVHTAKAEQNLMQTRKAQRKNQQWMCCMVVVVMVLALLIAGPLLLKQ